MYLGVCWRGCRIAAYGLALDGRGMCWERHCDRRGNEGKGGEGEGEGGDEGEGKGGVMKWWWWGSDRGVMKG